MCRRLGDLPQGAQPAPIGFGEKPRDGQWTDRFDRNRCRPGQLEKRLDVFTSTAGQRLQLTPQLAGYKFLATLHTRRHVKADPIKAQRRIADEQYH